MRAAEESDRPFFLLKELQPGVIQAAAQCNVVAKGLVCGNAGDVKARTHAIPRPMTRSRTLRFPTP
jgi:hypothetical protein